VWISGAVVVNEWILGISGPVVEQVYELLLAATRVLLEGNLGILQPSNRDGIARVITRPGGHDHGHRNRTTLPLVRRAHKLPKTFPKVLH